MGGDPAGPIDQHDHTPTMTERRIDASAPDDPRLRRFVDHWLGRRDRARGHPS